MFVLFEYTDFLRRIRKNEYFQSRQYEVCENPRNEETIVCYADSHRLTKLVVSGPEMALNYQYRAILSIHMLCRLRQFPYGD